MTPTISINHQPTPEELNRVKAAGYKVQQRLNKGFSLLFPDGVIEPYVFQTERMTWVFALRHNETTEQFNSLWSKS